VDLEELEQEIRMRRRGRRREILVVGGILALLAGVLAWLAVALL